MGQVLQLKPEQIAISYGEHFLHDWIEDEVRGATRKALQEFLEAQADVTPENVTVIRNFGRRKTLLASLMECARQLNEDMGDPAAYSGTYIKFRDQLRDVNDEVRRYADRLSSRLILMLRLALEGLPATKLKKEHAELFEQYLEFVISDRKNVSGGESMLQSVGLDWFTSIGSDGDEE